MAHRTINHRRNLAAPASQPSLAHRTSSSTSHRDPSQPISTKRVNPSHKVRTPHRPTSPPPPAANAEVVPAKFSLTKPNHQPRTAHNETHRAAKPSSKAKSVNSSKEFPGSKLHGARDFGKSMATPKENESVLAGLDMRKLSVSLDGGGGRRRSLGSAQVDVADFLANNGARIVSVDMPPFMQIHAVDFARKTHDSLEKFTAGTLASSLKKEFDGVYGPAWHCIVGKSFGSFVTHSVGGFVYFSLDQKMYVLLFKTSVQRAD